MKPSRNHLSYLFTITALAITQHTPTFAQASALDKQKLTVKAFVDFGHIVNGYNYYDPDREYDVAWLPLNRANVTAIQDIAVGRFDVSAGLSGLLWWPYGLGRGADLADKTAQVKPMVPVARARWQFGSPEAISGAIQVGTFNYKYNPDAKDLGEYLYRSGTYPGMLFTGEGWLLINRAGNYSHGALLSLSFLGGALKTNTSLFMETVTYPVGDFSPGQDFSFTSQWFEAGAGVVFNRYLAMRPSLLVSKDAANTYAAVHAKTEAGVDTVAYGRLDELQNVFASPDRIDTLGHWTLKGIKLMGRGALKLGHLLPEDSRNPDDLRIFFEVALLGTRDYPLYYENKSERMPIMFGLNIPTFRLLDVFTLQVEHYSSPYGDGLKYIRESRPIPQTGRTPSQKAPPEHGDDLKWALYAKRTINPLLNVYFQAANDHFRLIDGKYNPSTIPLTNSWKHDWYYVLRLEFNLR